MTALDPDDFQLVFDGAEMVIDDNVTVRLLVPCCELREVPFATWHEGFAGDERTFYGTSKSRYRLTVEAGRVITVEEVADSDQESGSDRSIEHRSAVSHIA